MPNLQEPAFQWADRTEQPGCLNSMLMDCGSDGVAFVYAITEDVDPDAMKADLLQTLEEWRRDQTWVDAVSENGGEYKERPGAHRWWPRDKRS